MQDRENSSGNNLESEKLDFGSHLEPVDQTKIKEWEAKIEELEPKSAKEYYYNLLTRDLYEEQMLKSLKKPYQEVLKKDRQSLLLYFALKVSPEKFEPQDIYEIYSLKNLRWIVPMGIYLTTLSFIFTGYNHMMQKSLLMGLTWQNCLRSRMLGFFVFPVSVYSISKFAVNLKTSDEFNGYLNKYDLEGDSWYEKVYKKNILNLKE